ncbi:uncharacterized protein LOC112588751 [Harpegnathos saltator]|uniref:uncharacterized protein LOC112588751 n=1 Tax=Harpegnathos saltator TaxID=610380 RepID=UPI000DBEDB8D|nr:uncharacterized protein LOC112588751 [Harpegnathos saltator]
MAIFPTNEKYKKLWMEACNLSTIKKKSKICSCHFSSLQFKAWNEGRRLLKNDAVPLLFFGENKTYLKRIRKQSLSASIILPDSFFSSMSDAANIVQPIHNEKEEMEFTSPRADDSTLSVCKTTNTSTLKGKPSKDIFYT